MFAPDRARTVGSLFGLQGHLLMAPRRDFVRADLNRLRLRRELQVALQVVVERRRVRLRLAARERHDRGRSERKRHEFPHHCPPGRDDLARQARASRFVTMAHAAPLVNWDYRNFGSVRRPCCWTGASGREDTDGPAVPYSTAPICSLVTNADASGYTTTCQPDRSESSRHRGSPFLSPPAALRRFRPTTVVRSPTHSLGRSRRRPTCRSPMSSSGCSVSIRRPAQSCPLRRGT